MVAAPQARKKPPDGATDMIRKTLKQRSSAAYESSKFKQSPQGTMASAYWCEIYFSVYSSQRGLGIVYSEIGHC